MPEPFDEQIHREMTAAFDRRNQRAMSDEAREALRGFIEHTVVRGIRNDTALYDRYRAYLMCRLEHIADEINRKVGEGQMVTWDHVLEVGTKEVGLPRRDCFRLIVPAPVSDKEGAGPEARICEGFASELLTRPEPAAR